MKMVTHRAIEKRCTELLDNFGQRGMMRIANKAKKLLDLSASEAFNKASDPITGNKWKRRKRAYKHRPLQKTGKLRASTFAFYRLQRGSIRFFQNIKGKAADYGWKHEDGTSIIPQRRFMGFSRKHRQRLSKIIREEGRR